MLVSKYRLKFFTVPQWFSSSPVGLKINVFALQIYQRVGVRIKMEFFWLTKEWPESHWLFPDLILPVPQEKA